MLASSCLQQSKIENVIIIGKKYFYECTSTSTGTYAPYNRCFFLFMSFFYFILFGAVILDHC